MDPETRAGTISADCPPGEHVVSVGLYSAETVELARASVAFTVLERPEPTVGVSLAAPVAEGTAIAVTMSFGDLASDADTSTIDYIFRADVLDSEDGAADDCEGNGLGVDRNINRVDEDPEVRAGTISADCPAGDYTVRASLSSAEGEELASASADFSVAAPPDPSVSVEFSPSDFVEEGNEITATMSFGDLASDADTGTIDYIFRADVLDSEDGAADDCEGNGLGVDRNINRVDEDPETHTGTISADCPAGAYTLRVSISSADNTELASASAGFFILGAPVAVAPPTLTSLGVSHGDPAVEVELSPAFESGTLAYRATVRVAQVTVAPTASDAGATVAYRDGDGDAIADADAGADGHQVDLDAGSNTVRVAVSNDGLTTTYTVKLLRLVTQQQTVTEVTLVSNTGQTATNPFAVGTNEWAQSFTTGSNSGGYNLSSIELDINTLPPQQLTSSDFTVSIWSATAADPAANPPVPALPDSPLHTLDNPNTFTTGIVAFSASGVVLMPGTYFVHVSSAQTVNLNRTRSLAEDDDPAQGWSIGDLRYYRGRGLTTSPWQSSTTLLKFAVKGSAVSGTQQPQSSDATLSGLTLSEGRLTPAFPSGTTDYTASVGYTVPRITVAPTTTDGGATVEFLDSGDAALADADTTADGHQVDLAVGENVVKVKVTAADGVTTGTYTVTVTRTAEDTLLNPPASDPAAPVRSSAVYSATFQGAWTTDVTPGGVPNNAHFTQLVGGVHNADVAFLSGGGTATGGVESVAEDGVPTSFKNEINAAGANKLSVLESETGGSNDYGATGTVAVDNFTLSTDHPRVTLITMIAPSPDWFVGVAGLSLLDADGNWVQSLTVNLYPWDAGTEDGTGFAMVNAATSPQGTITSIRGTGEFSTEPIATLTFARQSVNAAPVFPATETGARSVAENSLAGANVGDPVAATDTDTLVYSLGGDDSSLFSLNPGTGQISVASGTDLDYETKTAYSVTVTAADTAGQTAEIDVTISVTDVAEPPGKPDAPSVSAKPGSSTELDVSWSAPANTGPPIDDYNVQYRVGSSGDFTSHSFTGTGRSTTIEGLDADTAYEVQVQAHNPEGDSAWSDSGTGSTNAPAIASVVTLHLDPTTIAEDAGTAVTVTATLSAAQATEFTVTVSAAAVSPATDAAYTLSPNTTLTFTANATESAGTVTITPVNNTVNEPKNKVITVSGTVAAGVTGVMGPADVELTITDDDHPVVTHTITLHENDAAKTPLDPTDVPEGVGQVCIRVAATTEAALPPEIDDSSSISSIEGTAGNHEDFSVVSHLFLLSVSAYSLQGGKYVGFVDNCTVLRIVDDAVDEDNEQFGLFMQGTPDTPGPYRYANGRDNPLMVTIADDDLPTLTTLSVSHGDPAVAVPLVPSFDSGILEYDADVAYGVVQVTVAAEAAAGVEVSFVQADGSTAQPDADAGADGHQVALSPGDNVIKVKVTRGDESQTYTVTVTRARATVTIGADAATADEGDALSFTVARSPVAADELEVKLNVSETGTFVPPGNEGMKTVTIPADTASAEYTVATDAGDDDWDAHSTVTVALVAEADSPYMLGAANSAQTQVLDDDFPTATAELTVNPNPVNEGGTVTVTVTVTTGSDQMPHEDGGTITLSTAAGTAQAADYGALSETTFTLAQGDFSAVTVGGNSRYRAAYTATVSTVDDATQESDEAFSVSMAPGSDLDNRVTLGTPTSRSVTISANDAPVSSAATLSALSLSGVTFTPPFASDVETYDGDAPYSVVETKVTATPTVDTATVVIKRNGTEDADGTVRLTLGDNVITVEVTVGGDTKTYTVTVTRAQSVLSGTALVSNIGQDTSSAGLLGSSEWGQSFTTGSNADGYNLSSVELVIAGLPTQTLTSSDLTVAIWSATNANPPLPDSALHTLGSPGSFAIGIASFSASSVTLDPTTTYFVHLSNTSGQNVSVDRTVSTAEDSGGAQGWSIGNARYYRARGTTDAFESSNNSLKLAVKGSAVSGTTNNAATGAPTISGTNLVGRTQTANKGSIADADGLPLESTFSYRWIRVSDVGGRTTSINITGATSKTYTPVAADRGKRLKVRVRFTDDAGNGESRTSAGSMIIGAISCTPSASQDAIWSACLTVEDYGPYLGYSFDSQSPENNYGALSSTEFTVGGTTYTIGYILTVGTTAQLGFTSAPGNAASAWVLHVGSASTSFALSAAATADGGKRYEWTAPNLGWSDEQVISVWITVAATNNPPVFPSGTITRSVAENTGSGQNVDAPVAATDDDSGDTLTYSLEGADSGSFTIVSTSGQIQTSAALNYEAKTSYSVTVAVNDGTVDVTKAVTISVTDVDEPPDRPAAPIVSAQPGTTDSLDVSWSAPANTGRPAIDDYNVQYRVGSSGNFTSHSFSGTGTSTTITGLTASTSYQVQVQAHNDEGDSPWSASGTGSTAAAGASVVTLNLDPTTIDEDAGTAVTVTATLSAAKTTQFTVTVTAAAVSPATDAAYTLSGNTTLTFGANATDSTGTVTITPVGNTVNEENKEITVSGAVAAGVTGVTGPADVTLTITDNDHPVINHTLTLHEKDASKTLLDPTMIPENVGQVCIRLTATTEAALPPERNSGHTVFTSLDTAVSPEDFSAVSQNFYQPTGAYSLQGGHYVAVLDHCAALRIVDDAVDEDNEQFSLYIDPGPGVPASYQFESTISSPLVVTIIDNDPEPSLSIADAGGAEGADLEFVVTLDPASGREVTVDWAVDGDTATAGGDYTDGSGTLIFAPGDTTKTVTVATLQETVPEGAETFTVTLSNASNATIADAEATGTIAANDAVLTALALSGVTLVPAFESATTEYEASVASTVENTMVTATPDPAGTAVVIKLGGTVDDDGTVDLAVGANVITVEVATGGTYTVTVTKAAAVVSNDATLSALAVTYGSANTPATLRPAVSANPLRTGFAAATTEYRAAVEHSVEQVTVTPTASAASATIEYLDGSGAALSDADTVATGHQVALAVGLTTFKVKVTDGTATETYTVIMERDSDQLWGWTPTRDWNNLLQGDLPFITFSGLWGDGTTLWALDDFFMGLLAYTLETQVRDTAKEFSLFDDPDNIDIGISSDGTRVYVLADPDDIIRVYALLDGTRQDGSGGTTDREFSLHADNDDPGGIWNDGTTLWVSDYDDNKIYAYTLADGTRVSETTGGTTTYPKDVTLHADNDDPNGMWGNGTTLWVADSADDKIYAYTLKTGSRDTGSEFSLHSENGAAHSIWSHGTTMFVTERDGTLGVDELKIYTYNAPDLPTLTALSVSYGSPAVTPTLAPVFYSGTLAYAADVPYNITQVTVAATAAAGVTATFVQEDGTTAQPDDDGVTPGHQVGLAVGDNVIRVRAVKGDSSRIYTVTVKRAKPEVTISAAETMAGEGHDPVFTVTRSPSAPDSLTVKLEVSETGGLVPSGSEGMKTVLIPANTAAAEHTVTTGAGDDAWDAHSTVTVALVAEADSPYTLGAANSASTEIRDDDFPAATAALAVSPATASEGGTVTVTVTVTTGSDQEPHEDGGTVTLSTAAVSAQTADYGALSETTFTLAQADFSSVTVGGNSRYRATYTATVGIVDDTSQEGAETFTVSMARGSDLDAQVTLGTPTSRTVTIPANDAPGNAAPTFPATETGARSVAENTASGQNVGGPVAATDTDTGDTLTYSLEGADSGSFTIVGASGQIQTSAALNYEAKSSYSVTVKVNDGTVNATKAVTISVTDVDEPPDRPAVPAVSAKSGADDSLNVSWSAPANTGRPAIDDYNVRYRIGTTGSFTSHPFSGTGRSTTIGGLTADTEYEVQVQAHNPEGDSPWSASGTARTNAATSPVSSDATLSGLTLSPTDISNFQSGTLTYSVDVANSVGSVTVTPTANHASAAITVNGAMVASGSGRAVRVDVGSNTITIVVTAQDRNATESYTVTVTREASGAYDGTPQLAGANAAPWGSGATRIRCGYRTRQTRSCTPIAGATGAGWPRGTSTSGGN